MANPFVHVELATTDLDKSKSFYQSLFSWQLQEMDMGGGTSYTMINVDEGTGGGMMKHPVPGACVHQIQMSPSLPFTNVTARWRGWAAGGRGARGVAQRPTSARCTRSFETAPSVGAKAFAQRGSLVSGCRF